MNVQDYLAKYGERYRGYLEGMKGNPRNPVLEIGMLAFTDASACCWGGPFPGNYAVYKLYDYTGLDLSKTDAYYLKNPEAVIESPTTALPVRLYFCGNDDTSYSKFYAKVEEARFDLDMLKSLEADGPLDFHEFCAIGFVFTN